LCPRLIEEIRSAFFLRIANYISHSLWTQIYSIFSFSLRINRCAGTIWNTQFKTQLVPHAWTLNSDKTYMKTIYLCGSFGDCLCGLVVRVLGYRSKGPGSDSWSYPIFWEVVGLEWGPLSLASTIEELLERKSSDSSLEIWEYGHGDWLCWPRNTFYPQKLALASPKSGGRSVSIVRSQTKATEFIFGNLGGTIYSTKQADSSSNMCICEIRSLSLGWSTGPAGWGSPWFSSVPPSKHQDSTLH
jgi:hypothetical protein